MSAISRSLRSRWAAAVLVLLGSLVFALVSSGGAAPVRAQSATTVLVAQNATLGAILTDTNGMTLYVRTTDPPNMSSCSGMCAVNWPVFQPPSDTLTLPAGVGGSLDVIMRDDGLEQVTYNGMPLYYWAKDMQPGDTTGQGIGGFVVASPVSAEAAAASTTVLVAQDPNLGAILTDANGMTLYIRTTDMPNMSSCSGPCIMAWPAFQPPSTTLTVPAGVTGTLAVITRDDGTQQVTYNGMPLYYFVKDMNPGDVTGQNVANFVAAQP